METTNQEKLILKSQTFNLWLTKTQFENRLFVRRFWGLEVRAKNES